SDEAKEDSAPVVSDEAKEDSAPVVSSDAKEDSAPAVSDEAKADSAPAAAQVDLCATVKTVAGPILSLVGTGQMSLNTALNLNASLTGVTVPQVLGCLV
ncbi:hypothetical protein SAMN05216276_109827, partial [Streptosporangium subroseum]